jgi:8-oxo-dGTP pyrophosphatase MutT (NUDIX family)
LIDVPTARRIATRLELALAAPRRKRIPLRVGDAVVGWLDEGRAARVARFARVFNVTPLGIVFAAGLDDPQRRTAAMAEVAADLGAQGQLSAWRSELYAVAPEFAGKPWFLLERAAARYFGVETWAVHVNGTVGAGPARRMWFARRSPTKAIDPGMLDNLVGGGIAAGATVAATLAQEAWEEAGIPPEVAAGARPEGTVTIRRECPDGLQRETIFVHDLELAEDFVPESRDGEAVSHRRVGLGEAARLIGLTAGPDVVTADASLVVLDYLLRHGAIASDALALLHLKDLAHP